MKIQIGKFLNKRLKELGIQQVFGVPGDFNLSYLEQIEESDDLEFVGNCNELNAAYATDGYARNKGFGAFVTTYGVGDLSAIGGIAGSYTENIAVIHISGAPPLHAMQNKALLHHTLVDGNYHNVMNCMKEFTVAQTLLTPSNAAYEIDRVLKTCWLERRPVHLQLPSDITHLEIEVDDQPLILPKQQSDQKQLEDVLTLLSQMMNTAKTPVIVVDIEADRFNVVPSIINISQRFNIPYVCLSPAKNIIDEHSALYLGVYAGGATQPDIKQLVENSDCLIGIGLRFTDASTALFTHKINEQSFIDIKRYDLAIGNRQFPGIIMSELLSRLETSSAIEPKIDFVKKVEMQPQSIVVQNKDDKVYQNIFWQYIEEFIHEEDIIFGEVGTSNIALSSLKLPKTAKYIAQPIWGAIGYTVPALFGSLMAEKDRRQLLFIGDGSLQLTVQEISSMVRYGLKPIIFILNNYGYTIERFILGKHAKYNDVHNWQYTKLMEVFDENHAYTTAIVETISDLEQALSIATKHENLTLIEIRLDPLDAPEKLKTFAKAFAKYDYGEKFYAQMVND